MTPKWQPPTTTRPFSEEIQVIKPKAYRGTSSLGYGPNRLTHSVSLEEKLNEITTK